MEKYQRPHAEGFPLSCDAQHLIVGRRVIKPIRTFYSLFADDVVTNGVDKACAPQEDPLAEELAQAGDRTNLAQCLVGKRLTQVGAVEQTVQRGTGNAVETRPLGCRNAWKRLYSQQGFWRWECVKRPARGIDWLAVLSGKAYPHSTTLSNADAMTDHECSGRFVWRVEQNRPQPRIPFLQIADDCVAATDVSEARAVDVERKHGQGLLPRSVFLPLSSMDITRNRAVRRLPDKHRC